MPPAGGAGCCPQTLVDTKAAPIKEARTKARQRIPEILMGRILTLNCSIKKLGICNYFVIAQK
jgi:hypothetical protein